MRSGTSPQGTEEIDQEIGWEVEWGTHLRLAAVVSAFAAVAAMLLAGHVAETAIILGIIVVATMASWYQLEGPPALAAHVHRRRRH